jgi:hypothetical protein
VSLKIKTANLLSRVIRSGTISGKSGKDLLSGGSSGSIRKIDLGGKLSKAKDDGGLLGWVWNSTVGFVGWSFSALFGGLTWTISKTWGLIVGTVEKLKSFNWNATEDELEKAIKARNDTLAGIWWRESSAIGRNCNRRRSDRRSASEIGIGTDSNSFFDYNFTIRQFLSQLSIVAARGSQSIARRDLWERYRRVDSKVLGTGQTAGNELQQIDG